MAQVYNISSFTNLNNEESISNVSNIASDKGKQIYKQLYNSALLSMIKDKFQSYNSVEEFKKSYIIIDSPQLDYNVAPTIISIREKNDITNFFRKISLINTKKSRENVAVRLFFDIGM